MKRILISAMLILCLFCLPASALAAQGDGILLEGQRMTGVFAAGDTVYLYGYSEIYTWRPGDGAPALLAERGEGPGWEMLLGDEKALYAVSPSECAAQRLEIADGIARPAGDPVALSLDDLLTVLDMGGDTYAYLSGIVTPWQYVNGKFWFVTDGSGMGASGFLRAVDAETGESAVYAAPDICAFTPYRDGLFLCCTFNRETDYDWETGTYKTPVLSLFDPAADTLTPYAELPGWSAPNILGLSYDADTDTVYLLTEGKIYRMAGQGEAELCAYVPVTQMGFYSSGPMNLARVGDTVAVLAREGMEASVFVRRADPAQLPAQTVTICGSAMNYDAETHSRALSQMGDIPVSFVQDGRYSSAQELGQAIVSGAADDFDIFGVTLRFMDFARLMEKGYCQDLSGDEEIKAFIDGMYPVLRDAVSMDGQIFAIPAQVLVSGIMARGGFLADGYEMPASFADLCGLMARWEEDGLGDSGYIPFSDRRTLADQAMTLYRDYMAFTGQPFTLDTPLFREVMGAFERVDMSPYEMEIDFANASLAELQIYFNRQTAFMAGMLNCNPGLWKTQGMVFKPLPLTADTEAAVGLDVQVFFVNPRSRNMDAALQYLRAYLNALGETGKMALCPAMNEPVENPDYAFLAEYWANEIAQAERALETAAQIDRPALQADLERYREELARVEKEERYLASPEDIAAYREMAKSFVIQGWDPFSAGGDIWNRYLGGQITLEQYISEAESMLWKIRAE